MRSESSRLPHSLREAERTAAGFIRVIGRDERADIVSIDPDAVVPPPSATLAYALVAPVLVAIAVGFGWFTTWVWQFLAAQAPGIGLEWLAVLPAFVSLWFAWLSVRHLWRWGTRGRRMRRARSFAQLQQQPWRPTMTTITEVRQYRSRRQVLRYSVLISAEYQDAVLVNPPGAVGRGQEVLPSVGDQVCLWRLDDGTLFAQVAGDSAAPAQLFVPAAAATSAPQAPAPQRPTKPQPSEFPGDARTARKYSTGMLRVVAPRESADHLPDSVEPFIGASRPAWFQIGAMLVALTIGVVSVRLFVEAWLWTWVALAAAIIIALISIPVLVRDARARAYDESLLRHGFPQLMRTRPTAYGVVVETGSSDSEGQITAYWAGVEVGAEALLLLSPQRAHHRFGAEQLPQVGDRVSIWRLPDGFTIGQLDRIDGFGSRRNVRAATEALVGQVHAGELSASEFYAERYRLLTQ